MGQQLSSSIDINEPRASLEFPRWYTPDNDVNTSVIGMLQASVAAVTNGNNGVYQRIKQFYPNYTPLLFIKKQFQTRLAILHPDFLKFLLSTQQTVPGDQNMGNQVVMTGFDSYFKVLIIDAPAYLFTLRNKTYITDFLTQLATEYHNKYKINVFLFAEICSTLVDILSDCLSYDFANTYQSAWYTYFGALITEMKSLPSINEDNTLNFVTLREYMINKNYPFIEFSYELLGCNHPVIDLQHQWLVTLLNVLNCVILDNNNLGIDMNDIFTALRDYSALHFYEEEQLFIKAENYPEKNFHLQQHQDFLKNVIKISNDIQIVNSDEEYRKLLNDTLSWLVRWLTNHIRVVDRNMMKHCSLTTKQTPPSTSV